MKRKDVDEVNDGFFDFTLSSPALKIRRLDAEMVPIIDEQESGKSMAFGESMPFQDAFVKQSMESSPIAINEPSCSVPGNEERAMVLFNPERYPTSLHSPRPFSLYVDSDFLSAFKSKLLQVQKMTLLCLNELPGLSKSILHDADPVIWSNGSNASKPLVDKTQKQDDSTELSNGCLAVVPWVPGHCQHSPTLDVETPDSHISEMMDTDAMDIEDNYNIQQIPKYHHVTTSVSEGLNQWQQHCMIQQPPSNLSTPITWFGRGA